jgi:hypothetical protein
LRSLLAGAHSAPGRAAREGRQERNAPAVSQPPWGPDHRRCPVIELSIDRRVHRGLALWRDQGLEIRPISAGGLSVPSYSEPGRIYRVSLASEGRCSCPDRRSRKQPCKHVFAALIWAAKQRRALVLARQQRAA